jgi:hypothetical protein
MRAGVRRFWEWEGHKIRYQRSGDGGPAVLLVHGFGGNWCAGDDRLRRLCSTRPMDSWPDLSRRAPHARRGQCRGNTCALCASVHLLLDVLLSALWRDEHASPHDAATTGARTSPSWLRGATAPMRLTSSVTATVTSQTLGGQPADTLGACFYDSCSLQLAACRVEAAAPALDVSVLWSSAGAPESSSRTCLQHVRHAAAISLQSPHLHTCQVSASEQHLLL